MDQYNPFENSNHKVSKSPFEKKNNSSDMFEPTSKKHLETFDNYKQSERKVKKYTNKRVIKSDSINTLDLNNNQNNRTIRPQININKTKKLSKSSIIFIIFIVIISNMFGFIDSMIEDNFDDFEDTVEKYFDENDESSDLELYPYQQTCLKFVEDINNNNEVGIDVSDLKEKLKSENIDITEIIDDIKSWGIYDIYIPYDNYEDKDFNHILTYRTIDVWDDENSEYKYYALIFYLEGDNINDYESVAEGKILGVELALSKDLNYKEIVDTVKCGNCEYKGHPLDYYLTKFA